jgi:hypothetical protein
MHNDVEGQAIALSPSLLLGSMVAVAQVLGWLDGSVEVRTLPAWSTAVHSVVEGHDKPVIPVKCCRGVVVQALVPAVGSVDVNTPLKSRPTHNEVEGHAMPSISR